MLILRRRPGQSITIGGVAVTLHSIDTTIGGVVLHVPDRGTFGLPVRGTLALAEAQISLVRLRWTYDREVDQWDSLVDFCIAAPRSVPIRRTELPVKEGV